MSAGVPFPRNFIATIKSIVRRLFRVYAHLYNHHFAQLCALSIEGSSAVSQSAVGLMVTLMNSTHQHLVSPFLIVCQRIPAYREEGASPASRAE